MTWLLRAVVLIGVAVLVLTFAALINRSEKTAPQADCVAVANETTEKNPEAVWKSVYKSCTSNYLGPEAKGDPLLGPKAVRTVPATSPIGTPVPSPAQ